MAPMADLGPLPTGVYTGTMSYADVYPNHVGIGGVTTQDRALPAYADETVLASVRSSTVGQLDRGLLGTPVGWLVILVLGLVAASWLTAGRT